MGVFFGSLGLLLGLLVMLSGAITYVRGLPSGVDLKPGRPDPRGNLIYLASQACLGGGVVFLALDVVLRLGSRPFFVPGVLLVLVPVGLRLARQVPLAYRERGRWAAGRLRDGYRRLRSGRGRRSGGG